MKKYALLTSVLALAACGGGGGGSSAPADLRSAVTDGAVASNKAITGMASEVLVAADGTTTARSATHAANRAGSVIQNGKTYTSYRLDDVKFRVAASAVSMDDYVKFHMDDNGRIDSLKISLNGEEQNMIRKEDGDSPAADFRGIIYEYVVTDAATDDGAGNVLASDRNTIVRLAYSPDSDITDYSVLQNAADGKCPAGKVCRWDRIDQALRISSEGKSDNADENFKYSDFGKVQSTNFGKYKGITSNEDLAESKEHQRKTSGGVIVTPDYKGWADLTDSDFDDDFEIFAGGYDVLSKRPTETTHFTGTAIGSVYATNSDTHSDVGIALRDDNAELTFNPTTGTETLSMAFENWYDVTVTKDANGNNITFTNFTDTVNGAGDADGSAFRNAGSLNKDNFTTTSETTNLKTEGMLNMGYYGVDTTEEASGLVHYKETTKVGDVQYEREFRAGYGMKPDAH